MFADPLSPTPSAALNSSKSPSNLRYESYEVTAMSTSPTNGAGTGASPHPSDTENMDDGSAVHSSPFMSHVAPTTSHDSASTSSPSPTSTSRGPSPPKARPVSRVISGSELSPLKIVQQQHHHPVATIDETALAPTKTVTSPPLPQSPRKMTSPIKRFPVKVSGLAAAVSEPTPRQPSPQRAPNERSLSLEDVVRENEGLKHAIEIFEDEAEEQQTDGGEGNSTMLMGTSAADQHHAEPQHDFYEDDEDHGGMDDTMISTFSAFSAVPNLTTFAAMRSDSPSKFTTMTGATPQPMRTPRGNGPLPDRYESAGRNSTTNLMDFTEQMRFSGYPPSVRGSHPSPNRAVPATPQRGAGGGGGGGGGGGLVNLLDFDLPPMPTPRSIPSVTPRELESLKSNFLSEISSLKASLSGKEAEAASLKTAVGDAEKRVGECMEQLRELQGSQGSLKAERDSWEKRCREMEVVLRNVKGEITLGQREREELQYKLTESEARRSAAEDMAQAAESKMAGMRAGKASAEAAAATPGSGTPASTNKEVEMAVERVARDLHTLYKQKHETKVNALKKSYSSRWEKKVAELQAQVDELARDNEELRVGRDATLTRVDLARIAELEDERRNEKAEDAAHIKELEAEINRLEAVMRAVADDNRELRVLLERERVEKGELVILAEEMMNMQAAAPPPPPPAPEPVAQAPSGGGGMGLKTPNKRASIGGAPAPRQTPVRNSMQMSTGAGQQQPGGGGGEGGMMTVNKTANRMSGLRAPGTTSKIGRVGVTHERTKSNAAMMRPGSGSGIMTSIEKMGNYRGRD
ncbi:hypothetical protein QBC39DRAFT_384440 [Podospora conica]|nr:hypothetical protein QBC39DRAFT_384440 [Schizothecium conicum]